MYYLGFDIGGSSLKAALIKDKKIIKSEIKDLPSNLQELLDLIVLINEGMEKEVGSEKISGVGFAFAGTLDSKRENMLNSPNIQYLNNQPVKKLLEEKLSLRPIKIEHDVHCFLLAEREVGLAKDLKNVFYLTLGTGIGGAWMVDGKIFFGAHGAAGEVGHIVMEINQGIDFEELAANKFIKKSLGVGSIEAEKMILAGDRKAEETIKQLGRNLGIGIANIINIFDPEAIIISGGIGWAKGVILNEIQEGINRFVISPDAKQTKVLFSALGRLGGALGAGLIFENK